MRARPLRCDQCDAEWYHACVMIMKLLCLMLLTVQSCKYCTIIIMTNIEEGTTQTFSYMKLNHINGPLLCTMPILAVSTSLKIKVFYVFTCLVTQLSQISFVHHHHDLCFKFILGIFSFQTIFCQIFTGFIVFSIVYCRHQQLSTLFHG